METAPSLTKRVIPILDVGLANPRANIVQGVSRLDAKVPCQRFSCSTGYSQKSKRHGFV